MKKNEYIICVDMDDTIEDLLPTWLKWIEKLYNIHRDIEDITDWDLENFFPLTKEEIFQPLMIDDFWKDVRPKKDAVKYLKQLKEDGFKIFICTHSHYKTLPSKMENVLFKYFPYIEWNDVIVMHRKQLVNCDVLIDDGYHNLYGGKYHKILFDRPWNRKISDDSVVMLDNWKDIYDQVNQWYLEDMVKNY